MNHIYLNEVAVNAFAHQLVQFENFLDHSLMLFADVPLKCLKYEGPYYLSRNNLASMDPKTAVQTVDFLVCSGTEVILAITFDLDVEESRCLFGSVLRGIPHFAVDSLDFGQENVPELVQKVLDFLAPCFTDEHVKVPYSLPYHIGYPLSQSELRRKRLISPIGYITLFGRDCGLFSQCEMDDSGSFAKNPVTTVHAEQDFMDAMYRYSVAPGKDDGYALRELLDMPIETLFRRHEDALERLNAVMQSVLKTRLAHMQPSTYRDYLELVYRLPGIIAKEDCESGDTPSSREILGLLAVPLSDPQTAPILAMPLRCYFEEAALLGRFTFPEWLYRSRFRPFLNEERFGSQKYTLAQVVKYALDIRCQKASFPTLHELLISPICGLDTASET